MNRSAHEPVCVRVRLRRSVYTKMTTEEMGRGGEGVGGDRGWNLEKKNQKKIESRTIEQHTHTRSTRNATVEIIVRDPKEKTDDNGGVCVCVCVCWGGGGRWMQGKGAEKQENSACEVTAACPSLPLAFRFFFLHSHA